MLLPGGGRRRLLLRASRDATDGLDADRGSLPRPEDRGGHLTVDVARLAHRLGNRVHYSIETRRPHAKVLARVKAARETARQV